MTERSKRMVEEAEDRLSSLPSNVIDHIIEHLPMHDAVRTSILSRNWRYIWANHPWVILDRIFWSKLLHQNHRRFQLHSVAIVNKIFLQHISPIHKFVLDISTLNPSFFYNIDQWLQFLAFKGLKEFTLENQKSDPYKLPSCVFDFLELTNLWLSNCILQAPSTM